MRWPGMPLKLTNNNVVQCDLMSLKNYSTSISTEKTVLEIENILSTHGASAILKQYDGVGNITELNFMIDTEFGKIPFKLPMDAQKVLQILKREKIMGKASGLSKAESEDISRARMVGWRIIKDWIDSQLALVEVNLVKVEQVFLPYAYDPVKNQTLYEVIRERKFAGMLMEPKHP